MPIGRILIVDDSPAMILIMKKTLDLVGYRDIVTAENGRKAIEVLNQDPSITAILADWNMPEMTGIELLQAVRAEEKFKKIPFIMVTSRRVKEDILHALTLGANDYIAKPFDAENIKSKLARF